MNETKRWLWEPNDPPIERKSNVMRGFIFAIVFECWLIVVVWGACEGWRFLGR